MENFEGSIRYMNATCTVGGGNFAEITMGKVVSLANGNYSPQNGGDRRMRRRASESPCAMHAVIKNSHNELVGQKLGSGLIINGVDGAT
eukprot:11293701-Ditylum_brightwellii.AAC.1